MIHVMTLKKRIPNVITGYAEIYSRLYIIHYGPVTSYYIGGMVILENEFRKIMEDSYAYLELSL